MIPIEPRLFLRPTLRCETSLTWRSELRAAASTWLRRARAFACLACASLGWPGSIPKASSDLRSGQGVRAPTAVLGLRRGARSGELRRVCVSPCSIPRVVLRNLPQIFLRCTLIPTYLNRLVVLRNLPQIFPGVLTPSRKTFSAVSSDERFETPLPRPPWTASATDNLHASTSAVHTARCVPPSQDCVPNYTYT